MPQIDKTKPVLVTGATGYIAGWIVKRLLDDGITVHAATYRRRTQPTEADDAPKANEQ